MDWQTIDDKLVKEYEFADFTEAVRFINKVAAIADGLDHHPEIWNSYTRVKLTLSTHDQGDIATDQDYALAEAIDAIKL